MVREREEIKKNRKTNLAALVTERGGGQGAVKLLAETVGCNPEYLNQILRETQRSDSTKPRVMGAEMAARFEAALNLPTGWMDQPNYSDSTSWREVVCGLPDALGDRLVALAQGLRDGSITLEQFDAAVMLLLPRARIKANTPATPLLPRMRHDD